MEGKDFYRADPIASLLIEKCHLTPVTLGMLSIFITSGFYLIAATVTKTLILHEEHLGLLQDWFAWVWICLLNPVIFGYYLWSFKAIYRLIEYLEKSDSVDTYRSRNQLGIIALPKVVAAIFGVRSSDRFRNMVFFSTARCLQLDRI